MFFVIIIQNSPDAQSIFRYTDDLDANVAYYNAVATNFSAFKEEVIESFTVRLCDENFVTIDSKSRSREV